LRNAVEYEKHEKQRWTRSVILLDDDHVADRGTSGQKGKLIKKGKCRGFVCHDVGGWKEGRNISGVDHHLA
jgi:hypothetical protein